MILLIIQFALTRIFGLSFHSFTYLDYYNVLIYIYMYLLYEIIHRYINNIIQLKNILTYRFIHLIL